MKLLIRAATAAVLACGLVVAAASPASAATVTVTGDVNANGTWTYFTDVRHFTTTYAGFDPIAKSCSGFWMRLRDPDAESFYPGQGYWNCNEWSTKIVTTSATIDEEFTVAAKKASNSPTDTWFLGTLIY